MMPNDNTEVVHQNQMEIEGNKKKRSTYLIRTVNCSCSKIKNPNNNKKVIKMILIIREITIITVIIIIITVIIKCRSRSSALRTTNTEVPATLYDGPKATNITNSSTSDTVWEVER